jgi:3-hydroxyisobutyrate dehydrogenase-like beta-hydroxyacid dehydrogenase
MTTVGVLHPGAMGAVVGACLVEAGHEVLWASAGRSEATAERARAAGLADAGDVAALAARCEVLLSICPPDAAGEVAAGVAGFGGRYVDANAIAPQTAAEIAALIGPGYVDGGLIGPPPRKAGSTRLYLSGAGAGEVAALFAGSRLDARVLAEAGPTAASALKMTYAAWTKGTAAMLLAIEQTAAELGVAAPLRAEWALSQPQLADRAASASAAADEKGWRWIGEMREIAATFAAAGAPDGFHLAAAEVYASRPNLPSTSD